ncbi:MAG: valine--tRNA ligase [Nanoarchaeota archaeon]|nr:valine--tRNA ligase [Nanoarchaeota archaeon]
MFEGKRWDKSFEEPVRKKWKTSSIFKFDPKTKKPVFSIDTPPPYVNTPIHLGHATTYVIQDIIARYKRMRGFEVLFPLGLDRNGLPIEMAAEKKFGVSATEMERGKFISLCEKMLKETSTESTDNFYQLGVSFNSWQRGEKPGDVYYTDSDEYRALTQATFIDMWNKGLIYESDRINNYCPDCQTTIADSEIQYKDLPSTFNDIKFKVKETGEDIIIGTTRPELICTCVRILYNPKDARYKHLKGKTVVTPIYKKEIPIKAHPYAKMDKGTGIMMVCSFGDYEDVRFFREEGIDPIIAIEKNGKMNENSGFLKGMRVKDAREKIIEKLKKENFLVKQEKTMHRTPICERSKTPIEFIGMPEYYLKQMNYLGKMNDIAKEVNFFAPQSRQFLLDWINTVSMDWPISRRRFYATEIPLWYCKKCKEIIVPPKGKYYRPWKQKPPVKKCKCGSVEFVPETRVFDTWFDSSISPLYILKYPSKFFDKAKQCSLRPQGREIVRTWLYYTLLRSFQLTGKNIFENAWIHYHVVDESGIKMSKSLGNMIYPPEIIEKFGAEPFRAWCTLEGNITTSDMRCSFERIEGASKFLTKLWNVARFVSLFGNQPQKYKLLPADEWILKELNKLVESTITSYDNFDFHGPMSQIKHFIWDTFASHYIEMVKTRAYNQNKQFSKEEQSGAIFALNHVLDTLLLLTAPVIPFITHKIYRSMRRKDIEKQSFPEPEKKYLKLDLPFKTEELEEANGNIWKAKKDKGLSLRTPLKEATIPKGLSCLEQDLKLAHGIEKLTYGKMFRVKF